jgi:hypothetical protein
MVSSDDFPDEMRYQLADVERRMRDEARAEAREEEALVADSELREQSFADALFSLVNRGDVVQLLTPSRTFRGQLIYVGRDFVTLKDSESLVDVNLAQPCTVHVIEKSSRGRGKHDGPGTFEMRLYEYKMEGAEIEVHTAALTDAIRVRIVSIGQDHIVVSDINKEVWLLPLRAISYTVRRLSARGR